MCVVVKIDHLVFLCAQTKSNSVDGLLEALQAQTDVDVARRDVIDACKRLQVEKKAVFNPRMLTIKVRWWPWVMHPRYVCAFVCLRVLQVA